MMGNHSANTALAQVMQDTYLEFRDWRLAHLEAASGQGPGQGDWRLALPRRPEDQTPL
jgi:hypothetical protein